MGLVAGAGTGGYLYYLSTLPAPQPSGDLNRTHSIEHFPYPKVYFYYTPSHNVRYPMLVTPLFMSFLIGCVQVEDQKTSLFLK